MSDERPENDGAPRFGRRPRQGSAPPPPQHTGEHQSQAPKPKVRIGPRRPDAPNPVAPSGPRDPQKPQGGVRKLGDRDGNRGRHGNGQGGNQQHGNAPRGNNGYGQGNGNGNGQGQGPGQGQGQGAKRKRRRKDKFRQRGEGVAPPSAPPVHRPPGESQGDLFERPVIAPGSEQMGDSSVGEGGERNLQGLGRNARRRKRRKDRRDVPHPPVGDVFEPAGDLDMPSSDSVDISFEDDESDLNLVESAPPGARSAQTESDDDDDDDGDEGEDEGDEGEPSSDAPADGAQAPPAGGLRESRSKRRRKKRRERMDAVVDRSSGYWWADQWTRSFEIIYGGGASRARLQKGRSYSRRGQVTELEVGPNGVIARVQGSRPKPYQVRVELNRLRRETWGRILHQLAGKAAFLAQLLDGTLPPEIEDVFFDAGARLFPHGDNDVRSRCTCPDPVVPCKHVAAVHYALAEALQRDPFLLFALRGKSRDQFLQDLRDMRGREGARRELALPLAEDLGQFWRMGRLAESVLRPTGWGSGGDPARLVQSLGEPQLEGIREGLFLPMLESTYRQVSEGMRRLPKDG